MVATKLMTAEEFEALHSNEKLLELVEGEVREVPFAGARHGSLGVRLTIFLGNHVYQQALGDLFGSDTDFIVRRNPDSVLKPDVSFVSAARLPAEEAWKGAVPFAPDLAVEIESPSNTRSELLRKVSLYLAGGSRLVWLVRPELRTVTVFSPDSPERTLGEADMLDGGDVVPGFSLPLAELFRPYPRRERAG
jgi:Uma2 family endonuclease